MGLILFHGLVILVGFVFSSGIESSACTAPAPSPEATLPLLRPRADQQNGFWVLLPVNSVKPLRSNGLSPLASAVPPGK